MAARSIATATISFGLVTVPVRIYPAVRQSAGLSFHLLHAKDKVRLKQQYICPEDEEIVPRSEMVKGFEYKKGQYVVFTDEELKALDEKATNGLEITEFLPKDAVDPVYFEKTYYLGRGQGRREGLLAARAGHGQRGRDRPGQIRGAREELPGADPLHRRSACSCSSSTTRTRCATSARSRWRRAATARRR